MTFCCSGFLYMILHGRTKPMVYLSGGSKCASPAVWESLAVDQCAFVE